MAKWEYLVDGQDYQVERLRQAYTAHPTWETLVPLNKALARSGQPIIFEQRNSDDLFVNSLHSAVGYRQGIFSFPIIRYYPIGLFRNKYKVYVAYSYTDSARTTLMVRMVKAEATEFGYLAQSRMPYFDDDTTVHSTCLFRFAPIRRFDVVVRAHIPGKMHLVTCEVVDEGHLELPSGEALLNLMASCLERHS